MTSFRLSLALSLVLHGAALGTAWVFGVGVLAMPRGLHIELRPSEDAGVVIVEAVLPVEFVEVEDAVEEPLPQEPIEPPPVPVAAHEFALPADARFTPQATSPDLMPEWLAALELKRPRVPEVVEPAPLRPAPSALVLEVVPGANTPPEYPWLARRRGWQGVVAIFVRVGADGVVCTAAVARSSGHEVLDAAALDAIRAWRFRGGPGETTLEFEFVLRAR